MTIEIVVFFIIQYILELIKVLFKNLIFVLGKGVDNNNRNNIES